MSWRTQLNAPSAAIQTSSRPLIHPRAGILLTLMLLMDLVIFAALGCGAVWSGWSTLEA